MLTADKPTNISNKYIICIYKSHQSYIKRVIIRWVKLSSHKHELSLCVYVSITHSLTLSSSSAPHIKLLCVDDVSVRPNTALVFLEMKCDFGINKAHGQANKSNCADIGVDFTE